VDGLPASQGTGPPVPGSGRGNPGRYSTFGTPPGEQRHARSVGTSVLRRWEPGVIGGNGELGSLERLGRDVERLVMAICLTGSGVLGGLVLLVVFLVFVLATADTGIPNTSVAGVA